MITKEDVKNFVESHSSLVYRKETSIPGIFLLKYKNRVFYDNLWNEVLMECRGTLVDEDYNVVTRPFTKIFNPTESFAPLIGAKEQCIAFRKINGFMAALSLHQGHLVISTTGSTDSDFAVLARSVIEARCDIISIVDYLEANNCTIIVEIVAASDPHIIQEMNGVYLLGIRPNSWDANANWLVDMSQEGIIELSDYFGMFRCERFTGLYYDLCKFAKMERHEGYVIYSTENNSIVKLKTPYYLMAKFLARKNIDKLSKLIDNPHEIKKIVDEEFYPVVDHVCYNKDLFLSMTEQERLELIRIFIKRLY